MAKYDHKLFEKDIPKQQREELLKHVFARAFKALVVHQLRKVFTD